MMEERGVSVDHSSINRWAVRFLPLIEKIARKHKRPVGGSWRMDETYIKVRVVWKYLYRAVDKQGNTVDFLLTAKRDMAAAKRFFDKAIRENGVPDKVAMDKSGANKAAIDAVNVDRDVPIVVRQVKYLNNIVEQDHRAIKRVTSDQANAQLQIVPRRRLRARRRRAHAHDPQGPVHDRWRRCDVVRRPILCAGCTGPSSLRHPSSFPGKFRPRINNATQPAESVQRRGPLAKLNPVDLQLLTHRCLETHLRFGRRRRPQRAHESPQLAQATLVTALRDLAVQDAGRYPVRPSRCLPFAQIGLVRRQLGGPLDLAFVF